MKAKDKALERFYKYNRMVNVDLKSATIALKCAITEIKQELEKP